MKVSKGNNAEIQFELVVNGEKWSRVENIKSCGPEDKVYIVEEDENDIVTVRFGDGKCGKRLPAGTENVRATYNCGIGAEGTIDTEPITSIMWTSKNLGKNEFTGLIAESKVDRIIFRIYRESEDRQNKKWFSMLLRNFKRWLLRLIFNFN